MNKKLKNIISVLLALTLIFAFTACGKSEAEEDTPTEVSNIDVDLTQLSSTMVYSEVYNMMCNPYDYVGKVVKMTGQFGYYQAVDANNNPIEGQIYYACIIADATACCQQGIEFVLKGNYTYPDDYPELGSEITVVGTFETYNEDGYLYCHLNNSVLTN